MAGFADLIWVDMECADPPALAEFYRQVLGWDVTDSQDEYAVISNGSIRVRFGRVDGYDGPGWPDPAAPKRYPLGLRVDDVAEAAKRCLAPGAGQPEFQPGG
jgi:predicted enzyme related to lactoylglutathione lyase